MYMYIQTHLYKFIGFPGSDGKESACNAGDADSMPASGRPRGERNGNPLHVLAWRIPWTEEPGGFSNGVAYIGTHLRD